MGSLQVLPLATEVSVDPDDTEVPFGKLVSGSSVGLNGTNATASLSGLTVLTTTNMLYLNNTNATGPWYARIVLTDSNRVSNLVTLRIGIDNGTASTDQIVALAGALTQTQGSYVQLPAASTNRIYLTSLVTNPALTSTLAFDVYASDTQTGESYVLTKGTFSIV